MKIRHETNESGDWARLRVDGKIYDEGHRTHTNVWLNLLRELGHEVESEELPDEEFE